MSGFFVNNQAFGHKKQLREIFAQRKSVASLQFILYASSPGLLSSVQRLPEPFPRLMSLVFSVLQGPRSQSPYGIVIRFSLPDTHRIEDNPEDRARQYHLRAMRSNEFDDRRFNRLSEPKDEPRQRKTFIMATLS